MTQTLAGESPAHLRRDLQEIEERDVRLRRGVIIASLAGMGSMTAVTLLQSGIVKHLPDPPLPGFHSDRVNSSDAAYWFGVPDGALAMASLALNLPLAAYGGERRARKRPWIPILAAAKALVDAAVAGWYFYQMPAREKAWCGYCIAGAAANFIVLALVAPEARSAINNLKRA
jgi:uncharacterized membrane protein